MSADQTWCPPPPVLSSVITVIPHRWGSILIRIIWRLLVVQVWTQTKPELKLHSFYEMNWLHYEGDTCTQLTRCDRTLRNTLCHSPKSEESRDSGENTYVCQCEGRSSQMFTARLQTKRVSEEVCLSRKLRCVRSPRSGNPPRAGLQQSELVGIF